MLEMVQVTVSIFFILWNWKNNLDFDLFYKDHQKNAIIKKMHVLWRYLLHCRRFLDHFQHLLFHTFYPPMKLVFLVFGGRGDSELYTTLKILNFTCLTEMHWEAPRRTETLAAGTRRTPGLCPELCRVKVLNNQSNKRSN